MFWDAHVLRRPHAAPPSTARARTWYFGEGSQGFFDTYVLLANASGDARDGDRHVPARVGRAGDADLHVNPTSRLNVYAGVDSGAGRPVVLDRRRRRRPRSSPSGRCTSDADLQRRATSRPACRRRRPVGSTRRARPGTYFDTYILVGNPNADAGTVTFTFLTDAGATVMRTKTMPPTRG